MKGSGGPVELVERARATWSLLVRTIDHNTLVDDLWTVYSTSCREALLRLGVEGRVREPKDDLRCWFELVTFAVFLIMGREAPKHFTKRSLLGTKRPDPDVIRSFNGSLVECLNSEARERGAHELFEVVLTGIVPDLTWGFGARLNSARRLKEYITAGSTVTAAETFAKHIAEALDTSAAGILELVGMAVVEPVADIAKHVAISTLAQPG